MIWDISQSLNIFTYAIFDIRLSKVLLFWIELKKRQENKGYCDSKESLQYNFQLEHLMPKAWSKYWIVPAMNDTFDNLAQKLEKEEKISESMFESKGWESLDQWMDLMSKFGYDGKIVFDQMNSRDEYIDRIGNYTILSGKLNNSIKNYEWDRKVNGEGNKKGIKYYSSLVLNRELCDKYPTEWNEETITERSQAIKAYIIELW